jgi:hypothetical protein
MPITHYTSVLEGDYPMWMSMRRFRLLDQFRFQGWNRNYGGKHVGFSLDFPVLC